MGWYNLSVFTENNQTGIASFVIDSSNLVTYNGQHVTGFIICMMVVISFFAFLKSKGYSPQSCYTASTWIGALLAILLQPIGLMSGIFFVVMLVLAASSFIILFWFQGDS